MEELICYDGHLIIAMESSAVIWKAGSADDRPYIEEKRKLLEDANSVMMI